MAEHSSIEWTDATWNPITGCSIVSPGCTNCYAMKLAGTRLLHHPSRANLTQMTKAGPVWNGAVRFNHEWLDQPLRWKRPRRIFVCAHGDLFAEGVKDEWIDRVFAVMALAPQHTFQVLTKRADRMRKYLTTPRRQNQVARSLLDLTIFRLLPKTAITNDAWPVETEGPDIDDPDDVNLRAWPLPNVWLGVSAEDQQRANERIPDLLATPAAIRFVSAEPLLGPLDLRFIYQPNMGGGPWWFDALDINCGGWFSDEAGSVPMDDTSAPDDLPSFDWVIVGGESGPYARPIHADWARSIRDQCTAAGVPFFFKQWGSWREAAEGDRFDTAKGRTGKPPAFIVNPNDGTVHCFRPANADPRCRVMLGVGKKAAGRLLDGIEHNGMPA